jgi:hypothetical protein
LLTVIACKGMENLFGLPADAGIRRAVLAAAEGADDAEHGGVDPDIERVPVGALERETASQKGALAEDP